MLSGERAADVARRAVPGGTDGDGGVAGGGAGPGGVGRVCQDQVVKVETIARIKWLALNLNKVISMYS